uniref:Pectinesterase inhibitor domain-containing protein n=1 Tax=Setaria italica TaxID=4555 RepID=K3ZMS2_SETIT
MHRGRCLPVAAVASVCKNTEFPDLCRGSLQKHAGKYDTVDSLTVLEMQVDAFKKQVRAHAISFRDGITIYAAMTMAAQDMQNCDEEFRKAAAKSPVCDLNRSLIEMSENCRAVSNMIPTR